MEQTPQTALVTGGAVRIGRALALARAFARPPREDYLVCTRGFPLPRWRELRRQVLQAAVTWGLWMGSELAQVAVSEGLAAVPWGHQENLERRSMKPVTLIEALTDIYEVVIVKTGRIGVTSTLPVFSGIDCRLVLVTGDRSDRQTVQSALGEAATLGYEVGQMVSAPAQRSVA